MSDGLVTFWRARLHERECGQRAKDLVPRPDGGAESEHTHRDIRADRVILRMYDLASASSSRLLAEMLAEVIRVRASVYCNHPEYKPEWAPGDQAA